MNSKSQSTRAAKKARSLDQKRKFTAVRCLIEFLKANGHAPLESLINNMHLKRDTLLTATGEKIFQSSAELVSYILSSHPEIFLVDDSFSYYLNEEEVKKWESEWKNKEENKYDNRDLFKAGSKRESKINKQRRKEMKRLQLIIERDLKKNSQEFSPMTKAYLVLMSGNNEMNTGLKQFVRKAYTELANSKKS